MCDSDSSTGVNGACICVLYLLIFVLLKLFDVIEWSWFWVVSPLWLPVGLGIFVSLITFVVGEIDIYRKQRRIRKRFNEDSEGKNV